MDQEKIILGIDPGTMVMGYGIIREQGKQMELITMGVINLKKLANQALKLKKIFERVLEIINEYHPDELAPVGATVCLGLLCGVFGVVHVLALVDGVTNSRTYSIGGIKKLRVFVNFQHEMQHLSHLLLRGIAIACDGLLDGLGRVLEDGDVAIKRGGHGHPLGTP